MSGEEITFYFQNRPLKAVRGDSIAKALFDAGVRTLSFSVKYKRPRGIHCGRGRCIMCHMQVDGIPGVPTCLTPVEEGMRVAREDYRPFYAPLLIAAARLLPLPAGFYYRMFTRPALVRRLFLGSLRKMAGVGRIDARVPGRRAAHVSAPGLKSSYDVVVVGAGLSGMSAALSAAHAGVSVLLVDEYDRPGGNALGAITDGEHSRVRDDLARRIQTNGSIYYLPGFSAQGFYPPDELMVGPGGAVGAGLHRIRSGRFIFATGAYDVVPLFHNNDTPGIFGLRSLRVFMERDELIPATRAAVYGTGAPLMDALDLLRGHRIEVAAVIDAADTASVQGVRHYRYARVTSAHGGEWLKKIRMSGRSATESIRCDCLCTAFDGQGAYELAYQAGFRFEMSTAEITENKVMLPTETHIESAEGVSFFVVGELAGVRAWRDKITNGERAGSRAVRTLSTS